MKAFLLAAGHGTRLRPLTDSIPKCLVPIRGTSMLDIWLEGCRRAGISEIFVNLHVHTATVLSALVRHHGEPRVTVVEEEVLLGSGGTISTNRKWVESDPEFWVLYADVLTNVNLKQMLQWHRDHRTAATLGLYQVKDPTRCGVAEFDEKHIVRSFEEKPKVPKTNWAFSGILIGTPALLDAIPSRTPADVGYHVLPKLVGRMSAFPISDYLLDVGTMENYRLAQTTWPGFSTEVDD